MNWHRVRVVVTHVVEAVDAVNGLNGVVDTEWYLCVVALMCRVALVGVVMHEIKVIRVSVVVAL